MSLLFYIAVGLIAAVFGSLIGLGGGIIIVPALIYLGPIFVGKEISVTVAAGTSLAVLFFTALSSTITFVKQKRVDFKSGWLFFAGSGPGALLGAYSTQFFDAQSFQLTFGIFMMLMAILLMFRDRIKPLRKDWSIKRVYLNPQGIEEPFGYSVPTALITGIFVGIISGVFGIGGGSLMVPAMVLLFRYPPHMATATSMFVILLSSVSGSFMKFYLNEVDLQIMLSLAPSAVVGGWLGAYIAGKLSSKKLLWVLRISFLLVAIRLILDGLN